VSLPRNLWLAILGTCLSGLLAACGSSSPGPASTTQGETSATGTAAARGASSAKHFLPSSFFDQRLAPNAPVDPRSAELVRELRNMAFGVDPQSNFDCRSAVMTPTSQWTAAERSNCQMLTTRANIATSDFAPVVYTVPADQPRLPVTLDANDPSLARNFAKGVPIPAGAKPATGSDGQLIIWQPSKDTMWEFWQASQDSDGHWHASYGGVMPHVSRNPGHYVDLPAGAGKAAGGAPDQGGSLRESHNWGGPASSIPNLPGLITVAQLRSGVIGHALDFGTWTNKAGEWVYPAQRTDGRCQGLQHQYCSDIPQGARFRLDPSYDVNQLKNPIVRMIAKAVQDYGMVLNNTTGGGVTFYAEGWQAHGWQDPYEGPHGLFTHDPNPSLTYPTEFMREFPWEHLEMLKRGTTCTNESQECPQPSWWESQFEGG
jgi:hypothetical protein